MEPKVRPAKPSDKGPLMSFIKDVWGGHDYIPYVWEQWLRSRNGRMFVVEAGGIPVGMNRVSFLDDGSAWFQGARVHPEHRGKGMATLLGESSMKFALERGARVFRLTTGSRNYASRRQTARMKFGEIARFSVYTPPEGAVWRRERVVRPSREDLDDVLRLIRSTREFRLGSGVFWHNFAAASLTRDVVARLLEEGAVRRLGKGVAVVKAGGEASEAWEQVCFVGGPVPDACRLVLSEVGRLRDAEERWVFVPQKSPLISGLRKEGFAREFSQILFERRAANG